MAPARSSTRRGAHPTPVPPTPPIQDAEHDDPNVNKELFLDPMLGAPLAIYIEKDVDDKDIISQLVIVSRTTMKWRAAYCGIGFTMFVISDPQFYAFLLEFHHFREIF